MGGSIKTVPTIQKIKPDKPDPPQRQDERSISGLMPDPESDDDLLDNAHNVGEQIDEDLEHPKPVDIGRDVNKAEEAEREK